MPDSGTLRSRKKTNNWLWLFLLLLAAAAGAAAVMVPRGSDKPSAAVLPIPGKRNGVGARGKIEPEDGVMLVAAPYFGGRPSIVRELRIKEGDSVRTGQILAVLDSWAALEKALRQSESDVEVARTRLAQIKAGAKPADLEALRAEIARWESEYETSLSDQGRYEKLHDNQIISAADLDQKRLALERNRRTLDGAKERLKSLAEVRAEDIDVASAQLAAAVAQVEHARAELDQMVVRSPADGKVLQIHAHPGEEVGPKGILELAKTGRMFVVAEIYETDISRVHVGQKADISGELLPERLAGTITHIDSEVTRSELLAIDTAAFADTRVIKARIQLDKGSDVAGLIYGKVDVVIRP
jgi:HlyD family secretion protein